MARFVCVCAAVFLLFQTPQFVQAQGLDGQRELVNKNVVTILGGSIKGTYSKMVWDMSTRYDDGYDLRVLPVLGKGSVKGLEDLLLLKGIDIALVQSDVLDFYQQLGVYPDLDRLVRYLTVLYPEEVHLVARKDITSVDQLKGKRVNFGPPTSGTFMTASIVFDELGIVVEAVDQSYQDGLELLRNGEIDAMVRVAGAPVKLLEEISFDDGLHLLEIPEIEGAYLPAELTSDLYPGLISQGGSVKSISVAAVLAAYNWPADHPRRVPVEKFFDKFRDTFEDFRKSPYHPKWQEVDLDRALPGWSRWENHGPAS